TPLRSIIFLGQNGIALENFLHTNELYNPRILRIVAVSLNEASILSPPVYNIGANMYGDLNQALKPCANVLETPRHLEAKPAAINSTMSNAHLANRGVFLPNQIILSGLPRWDRLWSFISTKDSSLNTILLFPALDERACCKENSAFLDSHFFQKYNGLINDHNLIDFLEKNGIKLVFLINQLLLRHIESFTTFSSRISIRVGSTDVTGELIRKAELLITDQSSVCFDFIYQSKHVVFYLGNTDYRFMCKDYIRELSNFPGQVVQSTKELLIFLNTVVNEPQNTKFHYDLAYRDANNSERVLNNILQIRPKIYFMCYNIFGIGGTVRTTINLANYLLGAGFDVEIISVKKTPGPKLPLDSGIAVISLEERFSKQKLFNLTLKNILNFPKTAFEIFLRLLPSLIIHKDEDLYRRFNIHTDMTIIKSILDLDRGAVLVTTIPSFNMLATRIRRIRPDLHLVGQEHKHFSEHSINLRSKIKERYKKLDILTVLTSESFDEYRDFMPCSKLAIQENGTVLPRKIDNTSRENIVVSLGRLVEQKGYGRLIASYALIAQEHPDWKLEIYGDGHLRDDLNLLIKKLDLEDFVTIYPAVPDISEVLWRASIFALTSIFEPFGMVIIEALSHGVPVVGFDVPFGPRKIITKNSGILVEDNNIELFSRKLSELMTSPKRCQQLGKGAVARVKASYSIDHVGRRFIGVLDSLGV
ncbi:MAG: hypothetical protein DRR42_27520, partial [Gammaproteobacteria bacterium]